jgi:hypothetical protein
MPHTSGDLHDGVFKRFVGGGIAVDRLTGTELEHA